MALWVCLAAVCVAGGCANLATRQEKEDSFRSFALRRLGGQSLREFIQQRTALLVAGAKPIGVDVHAEDVGVGLKPTDPDGKVDVSSAAAIEPDGYFLTAAHCLHRQPAFLVFSGANGPLALPARVVWEPTPAAEADYDLAIVKVEAKLPAYFEMGDDSAEGGGEAVVTSGANGEAGGMLLQVTRTDADPSGKLPAVYTLIHNLPLSHGDSGGPLITLDGKLIGIEILVRGVYIGPREGVALGVERGWVEGVIERDRRGVGKTR